MEEDQDRSTLKTSLMSDDELMHRQIALHEKLAWANNFGSSGMLNGLLVLLGQVEQEQMDRLAKKIWDGNESYLSKTIETDPHEPVTIKELLDNTKAKQKVNRPKVTISRTMTPVIPTNPHAKE